MIGESEMVEQAVVRKTNETITFTYVFLLLKGLRHGSTVGCFQNIRTHLY